MGMASDRRWMHRRDVQLHSSHRLVFLQDLDRSLAVRVLRVNPEGEPNIFTTPKCRADMRSLYTLIDGSSGFGDASPIHTETFRRAIHCLRRGEARRVRERGGSPRHARAVRRHRSEHRPRRTQAKVRIEQSGRP